jgi:ABC-type transport system substrate-binding protein
MGQTRSWKSNLLVFLLPMLLLVPTDVSAQAPPSTGKAKVDRLVMGLINPYRDYMRPWINGTPDHNIQHDPAFEWLFEVDVSSGGYNPWLAKSSEMARDGRSWRIRLQ